MILRPRPKPDIRAVRRAASALAALKILSLGALLGLAAFLLLCPKRKVLSENLPLDSSESDFELPGGPLDLLFRFEAEGSVRYDPARTRIRALTDIGHQWVDEDGGFRIPARRGDRLLLQVDGAPAALLRRLTLRKVLLPAAWVLSALLLIVSLWAHIPRREPDLREAVARRILAASASAAAVVLAAFLMQAWRCGVRRQEPWHLFPANMTFRFYVHSRYTPGIPEGWAEFKTNSEGIRARERELERWDSVFSILCLGASTTENIVLDEGKHWPAVLERRLQSVSSGPVWVGNAGKSGYSTRRVARVAAEYIPRTRPKAVVLLTGFNEGITPDEAGPDGTRPGEGAWAAFEEGIERVAMYRSLKWLLFSQARLSPYDRPIPADNLWVAWERAQARRRWRTQLDRRWDDIDLRSFEADILRIYELCLRYGSRLVLCTQPTLYKEKMSAQEDAAMWLMGDITDRSRAEKMRHVNERLRRMSRKYDIPLVDLDRILPKSLEMFFDDCHFTQKGSDRVAEALSGYFERTLLLPASR